MSAEHVKRNDRQDELANTLLPDGEDREAKRKRLIEFLSRTEPIWKDEDHPEIVAVGTAEWVRALRNEKSERQLRLEEWYERE